MSEIDDSEYLEDDLPDDFNYSYWKKLPRYPSYEAMDILSCEILKTIHLQKSIFVKYRGGSEPDSIREIVPAEIFTLSADGMGSRRYLNAWCLKRHAHRVFRLDRIELSEKKKKPTRKAKR